MYARVTLLEIDTLRTSMADALEHFRARSSPRLREQPGYRGVFVLATPEGKGALMSLWETEEQAASKATTVLRRELGRFATLFRSPPGRERYEVAATSTSRPSRVR